MSLIIVFVVGALHGLLVGGAVAWLLYRSRAELAASEVRRTAERDVLEYAGRLKNAELRATQLYNDLEKRDLGYKELAAEVRALAEERGRLGSALEEERKKLAFLDQQEGRLREAFESAAAKALQLNNRSFVDLAKSELGKLTQGATADLDARQKAIDHLLKPMQEALSKVGETLEQVERTRIGAYEQVLGQVRAMAESQTQLKSQTANLVNALRQPSVRGRWGEIQLKRVVEMAGMLEHCDFEQQKTLDTPDGQMRPDVIVNLTGGKKIVIDAKAPLGAYLESVEAPDEAAREAKLEAHARQVRQHIERLGDKAYWSKLDGTPEFVVMFLPGETFFSAALSKDPTLIEFGVEKKVIPASPTTLIPLLRAVAYGWQQETIADSAQKISNLGAELYRRLKVFTDHFDKAGRNLEQAVTAYNAAAGSLEQRVLVTARKFREMGSGAPEEIDEPKIVDARPRLLSADELVKIPAPLSARNSPLDPYPG